MDTIAANFIHFTKVQSDINGHMPTLLHMAMKCGSIAEVGVRSAVSTWAFLYGLCVNQQEKKQLICNDLRPPECLDEIRRLSEECGIDFEFCQGDSAKVELPVVDMMFIDTWHVYGHLIRELEFHHSRVRKYIILHDTEVDKIMGETIRENCDISAQLKESGYALHEIVRGLSFAVDEFLEKHRGWRLLKHYSHCNGLTILEKLS